VLVTRSQVQFAQHITQQVKYDEFFVVAPSYSFDKHGNRVFEYTQAPFFSALTGRITYYEYETPEYFDQKVIAHRKKQVESITLALQRCDEKKIVDTMKQIGTPYLVTSLRSTCKSLPPMKKLFAVGTWAFWQVQ
jgi:hypothetical protein